MKIYTLLTGDTRMMQYHYYVYEYDCHSHSYLHGASLGITDVYGLDSKSTHTLGSPSSISL